MRHSRILPPGIYQGESDRPRSTTRRLRWLLLIVLIGAIGIAPRGQQTLSNPLTSQQHQQQSPFSGIFDDDGTFAHRQVNALNAERQKALVSDTEKLLKLAQELNAEIETESPESLNSGQMRKISNIEKLARNVKQKMSESVVSGPSLHDPIVPSRQP
jgi:hypothetical protein